MHEKEVVPIGICPNRRLSISQTHVIVDRPKVLKPPENGRHVIAEEQPVNEKVEYNLAGSDIAREEILLELNRAGNLPRHDERRVHLDQRGVFLLNGPRPHA